MDGSLDDSHFYPGVQMRRRLKHGGAGGDRASGIGPQYPGVLAGWGAGDVLGKALLNRLGQDANFVVNAKAAVLPAQQIRCRPLVQPLVFHKELDNATPENLDHVAATFCITGKSVVLLQSL